MKKQLAILGSTGSIGTQTLEVVAEYPDLFEVYTLTANNNVDLLIEQAKHFNPDSVVIANEAHYNKLKEALKDFPIKIYAGENAISEIVEATQNLHLYSVWWKRLIYMPVLEFQKKNYRSSLSVPGFTDQKKNFWLKKRSC